MAEEMDKLWHRIVKMGLDKRKDLVVAGDVEGMKSLVDNEKRLLDVIKAASSDFSCIADLNKRLYESRTLSPKECVLLALFSYLIAAEGAIANFLNDISYLLVVSGHDLYSLTKRQYVKGDIDDIRKVEMTTKIQFLKYHGFGALVKEYDSTFRNDIAHHNYKVDEQGVVLIRGKSVNLEPKLHAIEKMLKFANGTLVELNRGLDKQLKKLEKKVKKLEK